MRKRIVQGVLVVVLLAVLVPLVGFVVLGQTSRSVPDLGPVDGRLTACPASPNCVCSCGDDGDEEHFVAPFAGVSLDDVDDVVRGMPRVRLLEEADGYRRYEFTSAVFGFRDDFELLNFEGEDVVHVRSSSRVGHSDLGANRARVEAIRAGLLKK